MISFTRSQQAAGEQKEEATTHEHQTAQSRFRKSHYGTEANRQDAHAERTEPSGSVQADNVQLYLNACTHRGITQILSLTQSHT